MLRFTALCAVSAVAFYVVAWSFLQWSRTHRGPWIYTFSPVDASTIELSIQQEKLGIDGVAIRFSGLAPEDLIEQATTVVFDDVTVESPVGSVIYHDLMSLPGVVTVVAFGHEIETLPRGLFIDGQEWDWAAAQVTTWDALEKREPVVESVQD